MSTPPDDHTALPLAAKARLVAGNDQWNLRRVDELGLPSILVTDGPHGLRKALGQDIADLTASVPATCFPTASSLAASWDPALATEIGRAIGIEARANEVAVVLGPGVNIKRHPRCGRNFEYFSEDPLLSGQLAAAWIDGVQSTGVGTSIKHFAVNNQERNRMVVDVVVDDRTLREIYLPAFEHAITAARPWTVMCAYNRVNGIYCAEHDWLLTALLRDEWGFDGLVVSDWGANNDRCDGLRAGLDLEMPGPSVHTGTIESSVSSGSLPIATLDLSVGRVVDLIKRAVEGRTIEVPDVDVDAHHRLARRAAADGMVLLTNDGVLPLASGATVAVIGELAARPRYQGAGSSRVNPTKLDLPLDELRHAIGSLRYAPGYRLDDDEVDAQLIDEACTMAAKCDVAVVFAGLPPRYETEGSDRDHTSLPAAHDALIDAVCAANPNTVVVLSNGAPVTMPWVSEPRAIIEAYLGGQAAGGAIADVLTGAAEPGGRLAETFARRDGDHASDEWFPGEPRQVVYREGLFVGYRWFDTVGSDVLFPFGHGMSYTHFDWSRATLSSASIDGADLDAEPVVVSLTVANTGDRAGADVVQVYVRGPEGSALHRPDRQLRAFAKVHLEAGESRDVTLTLDRRAFAHWSVDASAWDIEGGRYEVLVAASSRDIRSTLFVDIAGGRPAASPAGLRSFDGRFELDDFEHLLGYSVPEPEPTRPFHRNSTIGELADSRAGEVVLRMIQAGARRAVQGADADGGLGVMVEHAIRELPVRNVAAMSGGRIPLSVIDRVVSLLNLRRAGRYDRRS